MSATWQTFRNYQVRPARPDDHPALADGAVTVSRSIVIERHDGEKMIICNSYFWHDSDVWASRRWRAADVAGCRA